jgi:hypothetical protein
MPIKGGYLIAAGSGALLLWSGLRGKSLSASLRNVISGKSPTTLAAAYSITTSPNAYSSGSSTSGYPGGTTALGGSATANKAIAKILAAPYGWSVGSNWNALDMLWTREDGWSKTATNASSGAYGIPQSLPASKMASAGANYRTSASTQIKWGLKYIKDRYGSPVNAWAHEQSNGWY